MFDNRYGTGQSTIDGIMRSTSVMFAGKTLVVCGYGWVGKGIALRAKGMGANVYVTEINSLRALEALMDGYTVISLKEVSSKGDIFITATGNINVIDEEHIELMKDGAILANAGHFNVEINIDALENLTASKRIMRPNLEEYKLKNGRKLYLLAEGRLVNLAAAEGHPSEVMDMSFANQALVVEWIWQNPKINRGVHQVPEEIDQMVADYKLRGAGVEIDKLTKQQENYLKSWIGGTE
jgi:adenosylhomocysteinase